MVTAIVITAAVLLLAIYGTVIAFKRLRNVGRVLVGITGILFSLLVVFILLGEIMMMSFMPKFERFDPAKYTGPTGKVVVRWSDRKLKPETFSLNTWRIDSEHKMQMISLTNPDGAFTVPTGVYDGLTCSGVVKASGEKWSLRSSTRGKVTVQANTETLVEMGPPITASVDVRGSRHDRASFGLDLIGQGRTSCVIDKQGESDPPRFQILSNDGKVLQEGKFAYG